MTASGSSFFGLFDYNDLATQTTPIVVTGGGGFVDLTNDELGSFTNKSYPPDNVTDVWDTNTNRFDFTELSLGSQVHIRLDLEVTNSAPNTQIDIALEAGLGASPYDIQWLDIFEKTATAHKIVVSSFLYMGDLNTRDNPAKFKIEADGNCTVKVNGWVVMFICINENTTKYLINSLTNK